MVQQGWICLHRKIQDSWLWDDKPFSKGQAWVDLILQSNHDDRKILLGNQLVDVKRGSFITSEVKLMERWGWGKEKLRKFLKLLQDDGMIIKVSDKKKTTISIINYRVYQDRTDQEQTTNRPQTDHNQTDTRLQSDTNNNENNYNNENNENKYIKHECDAPAEKPKDGGAQNSNSGKSSYTDDFEKFWTIYPRKKEKVKAFKIWKSRLKEETSIEDLIKASTNYALYCKINETEERFIKLPSTFLGPDKPYVEYIDFEVKKEVSKNNKNTFANYGGQREYDVEELKKELVGRSGIDAQELMKNADEKTRERLERVLGKSG